MERTAAVFIKEACKSYGKNEVLKKLNMNVEKGTIYGLLGASGCGKTTLLSCIVGMKSLKSGEIMVLGGRPGTKDSGVPGPRVGFMPQDAGLVGELTIKDTIYYFGRIMEMSEKLIKERFETLTDVMDLPPSDKYVKNCSGGQQRRVSFAASMVHLPELLILDEPTVGVDPVLREKIWEYLLQITRRDNMTVIITTHYIEEARQANTIGLMRDGKLLAQESPEKLLEIFQKDSLEEVFFVLSLRQEQGRLETDLSSTLSLDESGYGSTDAIAPQESIKKPQNKPEKDKKVSSNYTINKRRMHALLNKNFKQFFRNIGVALFLLSFPLLQTTTFLVAVGSHVKNIKLAVVNEANCQNFNINQSVTLEASAWSVKNTHCTFNNLSCRFLNYLNNPMIHKVEYNSLKEAFEDSRTGKVQGTLYLAKNFTESYQYRIDHTLSFDNNNAEMMTNYNSSQIKVWLDMSNRQIGESVKFRLMSLYMDFQAGLVKDCKFNEKFGKIVDMHILNGNRDDNFTVYMIPGVILTIIFFTTTLMTSSIFVIERSEGIWDRAMIAGVSSLEIIFSHFIIQICVVCLYVIEILTLTFFVFQMDHIGSIWTLALLAYLQGLAGVCFGFFISIICSTFSVALMVSAGFFISMICICGLLWPIQGMPIFLQWISVCLPFTIPINAFRNVMKRGWTIYEFNIWIGLVIEVSWIIGLALVNVLLMKLKR